MEFPETVSYLSVRDAYPGSSRVGIIFLLVILVSVEKGKQRYNKATKGNQQADYPYKYQNDIRSSHWLGRLPPLSWVPYWNTITVRQDFQSDSLFVEYVENIQK